MFALVELSWMLTIRLACMLELKFQVQMPKQCLDNGNFRLDHAMVLKLETIFGLPDISARELLKTLVRRWF